MSSDDEIPDLTPIDVDLQPIQPWKMLHFGPTAAQIERSYPGYDDMISRYMCLMYADGLNYDQVCKLYVTLLPVCTLLFCLTKPRYDDFCEYRNYYCRQMGIHCFGSGNGPYGEDLKNIREKKVELSKTIETGRKFYLLENLVPMEESEIVNGYALYSIHDDIMDYEQFVEMYNKRTIGVNDELFREWLDDHCCSDWAKQDKNGECYGGYWSYPDGSYEKENAYELSREDNLNALCALPYPREIIKDTVTIGCGNRMESVRYSNCMCEWVKRKALLVFGEFNYGEIPSLKRLSVAAIRDNIPDVNSLDVCDDIKEIIKAKQ